MTDKEKASDIYDICLEKKSIYCNRKMGEETCSKCKTYKMYKLGLAEGRKEGYEQGKSNERELQCGKKNYEKDIAELKAQIEELTMQIEKTK